jgi:ribonuclease VapC
VVVDTTIVLAVLFAEEHGEWAADQLALHASELRMSTVNLAEALIRTRDRQPQLADELEQRLLASGIVFVAPDVEQARCAAAARLRYPLNLGDCFAYALAVAEDCPILTLDRDFRVVDRWVVLPP